MSKHTIHYTIDGKQQTADVTERTATEILELAGENPAERFLIEIKGERRESYHDQPHTPIHLHDGQKFETSRRNLHFTVDDEVTVSREHDLPPVKVMELAGVDPKDHYLIRLNGHKEESFRGKADTPFHIHQNDKFITLLMAPTPVS
jgi:hypothetical protein